ncbi:MAG TPA: ABC transporter substrate-binding protein [Acidimicrobiales bacterium]|nr:ABC transporter substrate-binding protein [Acidimicrobiales bacterium]
MTLASASALTLGMLSTGFALEAGAASTPGVTAHTITIGATVPLSGIAAGYAEVSAATAAVFDYVNAHGGVNGRRIIYLRKDDCYNINALGCTAGVGNTPTLTQTQTLVTQNHVFAEVGSLGTAAQDSVIGYLNQNKVPDLFVASGSSDWNQARYPLLFGYQASYQAEGKILARWILGHKKGATVGVIGQGDDFGANGLAGLLAGGLSIASKDQLTYSPLDGVTGNFSDITQALTTLKGDNATVVVLDSIPPLTSYIMAAANKMSYSPQWVVSSVGSDPSSVNNPLLANAITLDPYPASNNVLNPWNAWLRKIITTEKNSRAWFPNYYTGPFKGDLDGNMVYGASEGVAFVEALHALGKNVTRAGIVKSMLTTHFATPSLTPLSYSAGNHQGLQGGSIARIVPNSDPTQAPHFAALVGNAEYTTGDYANSPIIVSKQKITPIPGYIK